MTRRKLDTVGGLGTGKMTWSTRSSTTKGCSLTKEASKLINSSVVDGFKIAVVTSSQNCGPS